MALTSNTVYTRLLIEQCVTDLVHNMTDIQDDVFFFFNNKVAAIFINYQM